MDGSFCACRHAVEFPTALSSRGVLADEIGPGVAHDLSEIISQPNTPSTERAISSEVEENVTYLENSYADQQIAVLGIVVTILGRIPLKKPLKPSLRYSNLHPAVNPLTVLSSASVAVPRVCSIVLITSMGVVSPAAKPPATAPATQCVKGSYFLEGFIVVEMDS